MMFDAKWFFDLDARLRGAGLDSDAQSFDEILENLRVRKIYDADAFAAHCAYVILAGGFSQKTAKKILERNNNSNFAVVVVQIRHYKYILDTFGTDEITQLLTHIRVACAKSINLEETFGHAEDGQFLLLLHVFYKGRLYSSQYQMLASTYLF